MHTSASGPWQGFRSSAWETGCFERGEICKHNLTTPLKNLLFQGQTLPICPANTGDAPGQTLAPAAACGHAGEGTAVCSSC